MCDHAPVVGKHKLKGLNFLESFIERKVFKPLENVNTKL